MAREADNGLPSPPPPNPARREQAMAAAMRRFDGESEAPSPVPVRPAAWWKRPHISLAVTAALVAIIAVPTVWTSIQPYSAPPPTQQTEAQHFDVAQESIPVAPAKQGATRQNESPPLVAKPDATAQATPAMPPPPVVQGIVAPPPPPPSAPPAPMAKSAAPAMAGRSSVSTADSAREDAKEQDIVVSGQRRSENLSSAPMAITVVSGEIIVSAQRRRNSRADERGDWNICTVNDPARSLKRCGSAIRLGAKGDAGRAAAYMSDGLTRAWDGDSDGAVKAFDQALAITPKSPLAYLNRGLAYQRMGDEDRALASFDQAIRHAPADPRGYYARSVLLRQRGEAKRAAADAERAARLDPDYADLMP